MITKTDDYLRLNRLLEELLSLFPELRYKEVNIKKRNDIPPNLLSLYSKALENIGFETKNLDFFIYLVEYGKKGYTVIPVDRKKFNKPYALKEGLTHEIAEGLFERDKDIAEKVAKFPLLGRILYPMLRLRIDVKTEKEVKIRLGEKRTVSVYDHFSDREEILRHPIKHLKEFMLLSKIYGKQRIKTVVSNFLS